MLLGLCQTPSPAGSISAGFATLNDALAQAAANRVDMLVLPELFLPGYHFAASGQGLEEDYRNRVGGLCARHGVALCIGLALTDAAGVHNAAVVFDGSGAVLATHRKLQLFGEDEARIFVPGQRYTLFDHQNTRFGLLICYDVEFPEHVRALTSLGAEVILVPTANMMPFVNVNQILLPARAAENAVTIVYANYCGQEGPLSYTGLSGIHGPDGYLLAGKGESPGLCMAALPTDWSERKIPLSTQAADLRKIIP